jgi:formylmethanofuran dehydrogenase subunit E
VELPRKSSVRRERAAKKHLQSLIVCEHPHVLDAITAGCDQGHQRLKLLLWGKAALSFRLRQMCSRYLVQAKRTHGLQHERQADSRRHVLSIS